MIYLDHNATTPPTPAVVQAMRSCLEERWANPSSAHRPGQAARRALDAARRHVADMIGARPRDIIFTSGGTEANDLAVRGALARSSRRAVVSSRAEHPSVRGTIELLEARGLAHARWARLTPRGDVDMDALARLVDDRVALVSIQRASSETGAIQPIAHIARLAHAAGALVHCDATAWAGRLPLRVGAPAEALDADLVTFAPHKFHGPLGVGVLWSRPGVRIEPMLHGTQEFGLRGGTENVPGIVGAGVACAEAADWLADPARPGAMAALRDGFERRLLELPGTRVHAGDAPHGRVWNVSSIAFEGIESEILLMVLSERGLAASGGPACASGSLEPSPTLLDMGLSPELAASSIRFSLSRFTTPDELRLAADLVADSVHSLRARA